MGTKKHILLINQILCILKNSIIIILQFLRFPHPKKGKKKKRKTGCPKNTSNEQVTLHALPPQVSLNRLDCTHFQYYPCFSIYGTFGYHKKLSVRIHNSFKKVRNFSILNKIIIKIFIFIFKLKAKWYEILLIQDLN